MTPARPQKAWQLRNQFFFFWSSIFFSFISCGVRHGIQNFACARLALDGAEILFIFMLWATYACQGIHVEVREQAEEVCPPFAHES